MSTYLGQMEATEEKLSLEIHGIVFRYQCNRFFFRETEQEISKMVNFREANEIGPSPTYMLYIIMFDGNYRDNGFCGFWKHSLWISNVAFFACVHEKDNVETRDQIVDSCMIRLWNPSEFNLSARFKYDNRDIISLLKKCLQIHNENICQGSTIMSLQ